LCWLTASPKPPEITIAKPQPPQSEQITVFITGNELGVLKPCGCTGGQLGGIDRRMVVFNSVPASRRLIIDTGSLVAGRDEQDQIKFNTVIQAYNLLGYDMVNLTEEDVQIAANLGLLDIIGSVFNVIKPQTPTDGRDQPDAELPEQELITIPASFSKQFTLPGKKVTVTIASFDAESGDGEQIDSLFGVDDAGQTVNILIVNQCDPATIADIRKMPNIDCLVCPGESEKPELISKPDERPLLITPGRLGRYVGRLEITAEKGKDELTFGFAATAVTADLPQDRSLVELYELYQEDVKAADLLEKQYRMPLPNGLEYVGSKACKPCHSYPYQKWSTMAHAHAYETLAKVGSQYDPECVLCHVVGMQYESGFVGEVETASLKDVGCEACHGPGSEHISTIGKTKTVHPMKDCSDCHTPEHSAFIGNETAYLEKIVHWREPKSLGNVKE